MLKLSLKVGFHTFFATLYFTKCTVAETWIYNRWLSDRRLSNLHEVWEKGARLRVPLAYAIISPHTYGRSYGRRGTHCECFVERARAHSALFVIGRRGDGNANVPSPSPAVSSIKTNNVHVRCECDINAPPLRRRRPVSSVTAARKLRSTTSRGTYFNIALHVRNHSNSTRQEAQLSPRDCAMRLVSWKLANCYVTVQKLLVRQVLDKSKLWSWRVTVGRCVINMFSRFSRTPTCDGRTDRQTDTGPWLVPRMHSIAR